MIVVEVVVLMTVAVGNGRMGDRCSHGEVASAHGGSVLFASRPRSSRCTCRSLIGVRRCSGSGYQHRVTAIAHTRGAMAMTGTTYCRKRVNRGEEGIRGERIRYQLGVGNMV